MNLIDYIPAGRERAISAKLLANMAGYKTVRDLQSEIHRLRVKGNIICSVTEEPAGYFMPICKAEVEHFYRSMQSRAAKIHKAIKSAEQLINNFDSRG